jgi:hypothetical protein
VYVNSLFRRRIVPSMLTGLGDVSSQTVQVDTTDVLNLGNQLRAEQTRLTNLTQLMRQDSALANTIGPDGKRLIDTVVVQQTALNDLITKYVQVYVSIFGQAPVGLGNPILIAAAVVVILSYVAAQLYLLKQKNDVLEQQAQAATLAEQNRASIIDQAQQKQAEAAAKAAAGDAAGAADATATANALLAQAGTPGTGAALPPGSQSFTDFLKANAIPIALTVGAIVFVPKLMDRF